LGDQKPPGTGRNANIVINKDQCSTAVKPGRPRQSLKKNEPGGGGSRNQGSFRQLASFYQEKTQTVICHLTEEKKDPGFEVGKPGGVQKKTVSKQKHSGISGTGK